MKMNSEGNHNSNRNPILPINKLYLFTTIFILLLCYNSESISAATIGNNKRPAPVSQTTNTAKKQATGGTKVMEEAFVNAGQNAGIEIWRIEDFKPAAYAKNEYGKFYTGDSYIVLHTKVDKKGNKAWNIHFWLGLESSQDEAGAAAILSVQLDDQLGGVPIQYREVQEHESQLFLSYFKNGVRYLPGGVKSGFSHVDRNAFEKRLFQVKGSRNIRVKQVDAAISSMNKGDCFILDVGQNIYVYVGKKSKRVERLKAIAAANQIRDQDHAGKAKVNIIDEYSSESDFEGYFNALGGGNRNAVPDETVGGDDQQFEANQEKIVSLYKVSDASGSLKADLIGQKPLQQSQLDSNDCFILDTTDSNIFVWIGKKCNMKEKSESMSKAQEFLKSKKYPSWTKVQRLVEGAETTAFTQYFKTWKGTGELHTRLVRSLSKEENDAWEPRLFHAEIRQKGGKFRVEEIFDFEQKDLYEDDVMLLDVGNEIFVWIGNGACDAEKSGAKDLAISHIKKLNRDEIPITLVNQGDESPAFKSLFPEWEPDLWDKLSTYSEIKEKLKQANELI